MKTQFVPCRKCKHVSGPIPNGYYKIVNEEGGEYIQECDHHKKWRLEEELYLKYTKSGFDISKYDIRYPEDYKGSNKESLERIINYVKKFDNPAVSRAIVYMYGKNGTQKSAISNWIGKQLLFRRFSVQYTSMKILIDTLWKAQRDQSSENIINKLLNCDLFIIDESFDKNKVHLWQSGNQIGYIDSFIRNRMTLNNGIIFISNKKIDEITGQGFSADIQDLIKRETGLIDSFLEFKDNYYDNLETMPERIF